MSRVTGAVPAERSQANSVLVTSRSFASVSDAAHRRLEDHGLTVERGPSDHDLEALVPLLRRSVAWIAGAGEVSAAHLDAAPSLRIVARYGIGVEAVDLRAASERHVRVTNTPDANTQSVADLALALLLVLLRGIGRMPAASGGPGPPQPRELGALTVGLVGVGRIGQAMARRLQGFGARVRGYDPDAHRPVAEQVGVRLCELSELRDGSDAISLHRPGGERLIEADFVARMREGAILVNTAREDLVDEPAIADALKRGHLAGYAADVGGRPGGPLDGAPNVLLTPHVGAHTAEAIDRMSAMAVEEVLRALQNDPPRSPVLPPPRSHH